MTHDEVRIALGALALGALDEEEAAAVRAHLGTCSDCQREYDELRGIPALLGLVSASEVVDGPQLPTAQGSERLLAQVAAERRAKQRRGVASRFAGALALAAAASVIGFVVAEGAAEEVEQPDFTLANTDEATGVWAQVALSERGWGTDIELEMSGATVGETCQLFAVSGTGESEPASSWVVPDSDREYITIPGAVGAQPDEIDHFDIVTGDGELLVRISLGPTPSAP
jgi:hypothetical protein